MLPPSVISTRVRAALLVGAAVVLTGCGADADPATVRVVACWGTDAPRPDTGVVVFEFEQDGDVVATGSGPVDVAIAAEVPAGKVTTVLVNGEEFGKVGVDGDRPAIGDRTDDTTGPNGYYALMGQGCPDPSVAAGA